MPSAEPIPIKAIPTVAEVVQELPVAIEIIMQIITEAGKKILGFRSPGYARREGPQRSLCAGIR